MGDHSGIEWTDATWNVMTGCTEISAGCDHCYARTLAETRLRDVYLKRPPVNPNAKRLSSGLHGEPQFLPIAAADDPFAPRFWPERLDQPLRWTRPRRVFVNSMSDVFHADFSGRQIFEVFDVMHQATAHQFQLLTKRPERALRLARDLPWPENLWFGVSIEDMKVAHRADTLRQIPAKVRWISAEPLLGPIDDLDLSGIAWLVLGGESGDGARPMDPAWVWRAIVKARDTGTAVFVKQLGGARDKRGDWSKWPPELQHLKVREYPTYTLTG